MVIKMKIKSIIKTSPKFIFGCLVILFVCSCQKSEAPKAAEQRPDAGAGEYNLPYEIPNKDSIKNVMDRVLAYFNKAREFRIIDKKTKQPITDFAKLNLEADLEREGTNDIISLWGYPMGVTYIGMLNTYQITGDKKYYDYPIKNFNFYFDKLPYFIKIDSVFGVKDNMYRTVLHTRSLDDCGAMGASLIKWYKATRDERYLPVINSIADYISNKQFRLKDGTLARQRPQPESVWGDDAYMCVPFLAQMGSLTGDSKYFDDAAKQIINMSKYLWHADKKLFDHGKNIYNEYDPAFYWSRANGWIILATCELLDVLPKNHKEREKILTILRLQVHGLAEWQGIDGFWNNLVDRNDSYPETSGTAMFVYGIAHAINEGWIDHTFGSVAQAGWNALVSKVKPNGLIEGTCFGTTFAGDIVYYYHRPARAEASHGYGPLLLAGAEMIRLLSSDRVVVQKQWRAFHYRLKSDLDKIKEH